MLFWPSPAQPASANDSSRIAARFAELPKMQPVFRMPNAARDVLRPSACEMEFASRSSSHPAIRQLRPATIAGATVQAGMVPRPRRGNVGRNAAPEYPHPPLVAGATCLILAFGD